MTEVVLDKHDWDQKMKKIKLDKKEAALEKEIEIGEWFFVPDMENEITKLRVQAHNFRNKNKNIAPGLRGAMASATCISMPAPAGFEKGW